MTLIGHPSLAKAVHMLQLIDESGPSVLCIYLFLEIAQSSPGLEMHEVEEQRKIRADVSQFIKK